MSDLSLRFISFEPPPDAAISLIERQTFDAMLMVSSSDVPIDVPNRLMILIMKRPRGLMRNWLFRKILNLIFG